MSVKRNRNDEISECDNYMKRLKVSTSIPIKEVIYSPSNKEIINNIKESENSLNVKIKIIEESVENRLNHIDNEITNINTKLDKLINIITNSFFEKPSYNYQSNYVN